jgi:hypothetical protein
LISCTDWPVECFSFGAELLCFPRARIGLGASNPSSATPMQQKREILLRGAFFRPESLVPRLNWSLRGCDAFSGCLESANIVSLRFFWRSSPSWMSIKPNRSTRVSTLVLSLIVADWRSCGNACAADATWFLCCQQYASGSRLLFCDLERIDGLAMARLHGRPVEVSPRHVAAGFFESERGIQASGV